MRKLQILFFLWVGLWTCDIKGQNNFAAEYEESLKTWEKLRDENNNSYTYKLTYSGMAGTTETIVIVKKGVVRQISIFRYSPDKKFVSKNTYKKQEAISKAKTIDEIYQFAKEEVLSKRKQTDKYTIYFQVNSQSKLIKKTGYYPIGCMDDCFVGYTIEEIKF